MKALKAIIAVESLVLFAVLLVLGVVYVQAVPVTDAVYQSTEWIAADIDVAYRPYFGANYFMMTEAKITEATTVDAFTTLFGFVEPIVVTESANYHYGGVAVGLKFPIERRAIPPPNTMGTSIIFA